MRLPISSTGSGSALGRLAPRNSVVAWRGAALPTVPIATGPSKLDPRLADHANKTRHARFWHPIDLVGCAAVAGNSATLPLSLRVILAPEGIFSACSLHLCRLALPSCLALPHAGYAKSGGDICTTVDQHAGGSIQSLCAITALRSLCGLCRIAI